VSAAPSDAAPVVPGAVDGASPSGDVVLGLAPGSLLGVFNRSGVVSSADVHVALTLARLAGEIDEAVALAVALAVRAPRFGHVFADLASAREVAAIGDVDEVVVGALPWPQPRQWLEAVASSPLVATIAGDAGNPGAGTGGAAERERNRPLVLEGTALYLDRHWRDECAVAADLADRAAGPRASDPSAAQPLVVADADAAELAAVLSRLFPGEGAEQRAAAATALVGRLAVIVGGPGTGKTTTVARFLAALFEIAEARGDRPPLVALAAPTGKAAARMAEAVRREADEITSTASVRQQLLSLEAATVHRLLGSFPGRGTRFRHNAANLLPHDVVVVDETSMMSLWLMARLVEAVRPTARLVLVGDPEQLASVEAGVVLADVAGPAGRMATASPAAAQVRSALSGAPEPAGALIASPTAIGDCVAALRTNHRFGGALAEFAAAVRGGDATRALEALRAGDDTLGWEEVGEGDDEAAAAALGDAATEYGRRLVDAANEGAEAALEAVDTFRILCAHRRGPAGAATWNDRVRRSMGAVLGLAPTSEWYSGRPVIVTANDYALRLFNGDVGVAVGRPGGGVALAFRRGSEIVPVSPALVGDVAPVYAMTIHRSQGSEFDNVAVVLPDPTSRVLTRELLYTAVTRARHGVVIVGSEASLRAGIGRRVARASGLLRRLWGPVPDDA
jgi:exodeoxyribonuclease V alpha subunit